MANSTTMTPAEREAYWKGMEEAAKMLDEIVSGMAAHTDSAGNITGEDFHVPEINYIRCAAEDIRSLIAQEKINADAVPQAEQTGPLAPAELALDLEPWNDHRSSVEIHSAESAPLSDAATVRVPRGLNPATADLVIRFAAALAEKLRAAELKYGYSDYWMDDDWMDKCRDDLRKHVEKGDPRDVAAYCAFLWHHGESTAMLSAAPAQGEEP